MRSWTQSFYINPRFTKSLLLYIMIWGPASLCVSTATITISTHLQHCLQTSVYIHLIIHIHLIFIIIPELSPPRYTHNTLGCDSIVLSSENLHFYSEMRPRFRSHDQPWWQCAEGMQHCNAYWFLLEKMVNNPQWYHLISILHGPI